MVFEALVPFEVTEPSVLWRLDLFALVPRRLIDDGEGERPAESVFFIRIMAASRSASSSRETVVAG